MASFDVAHLQIQGVNVVIVFVASQFGNQTQQSQRKFVDALQACSTSAGLAGNVVVVWTDPFGNVQFLAPPKQHPYFRTANYAALYSQRNKTLSCG
jgi:hypothetical protein